MLTIDAIRDVKGPNEIEDVINYAKKIGFGDIHFKIDPATNLIAIIAIHSTKLGPALGGCRFLEYPSFTSALQDAIRLAWGMSYKAAISGLPLGGGKSVLLKPKVLPDRAAYFEAFGRFIEELGGRYITAVDSGTTTFDMDAIARSTSYVTSTSAVNGDPSPYTALGVRKAIEAAVKFQLGKNDLSGIHVAIQGVGNVGYYLAKELHQLGAKLTVSDINPVMVQRCVNEFAAATVETQLTHKVACDVFAPCALGAILNDRTIAEIKAPIIAGAANNQLAETRHGDLLQQRGILYAPDYVINSGGLIDVAAQYYHDPKSKVIKQVENIYNTTMNIFELAKKENAPTSNIADRIAAEKIAG